PPTTADACQNPTPSTVRHFADVMIDQDVKTCIVTNDYSREVFHWNEATRAWISQDGPTGPCGTVQIGTQHDDSAPQFWKYTETTVRTNPSGALNGLSCSMFPGYTFHYTWRAANNWTDCRYLESLMN